MSEAAGARSLWLGSPRPARESLSMAVAALTRARCLQVLVDHGFGGLLAGLSLATLLVLAARLIPLPYSPWQLAGAAVIIAVALALLLGWQRRPDALEVAIRADLALKLKQRLSTAWEVITVRGDSELAERLSVQAVKAGLPTHPGRLFPLRVNRWGQLSALAALALLLVSVVDLHWMQAPVPREIDEKVVREGQRLGAFGREMQERARRDRLPRSERQAERLERLGARMESGALDRGEALGQLRGMRDALDEEQMQARSDADQTDIGPLRGESAQTPPLAPDVDPRALAEKLADLERSGVPRSNVEDAPGRQLPGDNEGLREMLEKLAQIDRARREDKELQSAREQVLLALENLGESGAGTGGGRSPGVSLDFDEEEDRGGKNAADAGGDGRRRSEMARGATRSGAPGDSSVFPERRHAPVGPDSRDTGPLLKPESQAREGEVFVTEARVLPKPGRPSAENVAMSSEFASQVEEVLSKEEYPAHYKEFVRRYFLTLSQGRIPQQQPTDKRGAK
ncbi:MAG TPA: hypothetical protein VLC73_11080 [Burkholderiales bacterium]|nr:hypothetical protein [Burkholderiales bacterium]